MAPTRPMGVRATRFDQRDVHLTIRDPSAGDLRGLSARIRYVDTRPSPRAPFVLFLHGHGSRIEEGEELFEALLTHGIGAVAFDMPCSGYSSHIDPPPGQAFRLDILRWFTCAFVETILGRAVSVVGGGMGGNLALRFASQHRHCVARVVAWSPSGAWDADAPALRAEQAFSPAAQGVRGVAGIRIALSQTMDRWHRGVAFDQPECPDSPAPEWSPGLRQAHLAEVVPYFEEAWTDALHDAYFEIAREQLATSLWGTTLSGIRCPVLLIAAKYDNSAPEHLCEGTKRLHRDLRAMVPSRPDRWLCEIGTGRLASVEAPCGLARKIAWFFRDTRE